MIKTFPGGMIAYLDDKFNPVDPDKATLVEIRDDNGDITLARPTGGPKSVIPKPREAIVSMNPDQPVSIGPNGNGIGQLRRMGQQMPRRPYAITPPIAHRVVSREAAADDCAAGGGYWRTLAHGPVCIGGAHDPDSAGRKLDAAMETFEDRTPKNAAARDKMEQEIAQLPHGKKILEGLERVTSAWTGADFQNHAMMRSAMNEFLSQSWYPEYHAWAVDKLKEMAGTNAVTLWRGQYGPAWVATVNAAAAAGKPVVEIQPKDVMSWTTSREMGDYYGKGGYEAAPSILAKPGQPGRYGQPTPGFSMVVPLDKVVMAPLTDPFWPYGEGEHEMVVMHRGSAKFTGDPALDKPPAIHVRMGKGQTVEAARRSNVYKSNYVVPDEQTNFAYWPKPKKRVEYTTREAASLEDCDWITKNGRHICIGGGHESRMEDEKLQDAQGGLDKAVWKNEDAKRFAQGQLTMVVAAGQKVRTARDKNGQVIGVAVYEVRRDRQDQPPYLYVGTLASSGNMKGIGTALMRSMAHVAAGRNMAVLLHAAPSAIDFYRKIGMTGGGWQRLGATGWIQTDPNRMEWTAEQAKAFAAHGRVPKAAEGEVGMPDDGDGILAVPASMVSKQKGVEYTTRERKVR